MKRGNKIWLASGIALAVAIAIIVITVSIVYTNASATQVYQGTAGAGDYWQISINRTAKTISYTNFANNTTGTVSYTVNVDGTYDITDSTDNLVRALEIPGYACLLQAKKGGSSGNIETLVIGVVSTPINLSTIRNKQYNYMQFRTSNGGSEIGYVTTANTAITHGGYSPYGASQPDRDAVQAPVTMELLVPSNIDSTGRYISVVEADGTSYLFNTTSGHLALDMANGSIFCVEQADTSAFKSSYTGTYTVLYYQKQGVTPGQNNSETGDITLGKAKLVIQSGGAFTVTDISSNTAMSTGTLVPMASADDIVGSGGLDNDMKGAFISADLSTSTTFYIIFKGDTVLLSQFRDLGNREYEYYYGAALK